MKAGFDASAFPYTTKNPELLEVITSMLKTQEVPEETRIGSLSEKGKGKMNR